MIINRHGATFEHAGVTYTIGASVVGTDQSEYEGLTGYIYEVRDGADKETENETPDLYCNFDPPDDPAEIAELEAVFSDLYDEPKTLEDIILDCVIMAPNMVRPYQTYRIPVVWESWGVLSIDAGSLEQAAALALDSEMPLPDQKEYVDESIRVDWESVGGCNAPMPDDSAICSASEVISDNQSEQRKNNIVKKRPDCRSLFLWSLRIVQTSSG